MPGLLAIEENPVRVARLSVGHDLFKARPVGVNTQFKKPTTVISTHMFLGDFLGKTK